MGHTLSDNRHGLVVSAVVTHADGYAEREAAKAMLNDARQVANDPGIEVTVGADKGYDAEEFVQACLDMKVTPHVAQNTSGRRSAVPDEIARSVGYAISQQKRKLIEQGFGWVKTVGRMRQVIDEMTPGFRIVKNARHVRRAEGSFALAASTSAAC